MEMRTKMPRLTIVLRPSQSRSLTPVVLRSSATNYSSESFWSTQANLGSCSRLVEGVAIWSQLPFSLLPDLKAKSR